MSHSLENHSVWLITGCSTGMGRHFALTLLSLGQKVIATARNIDQVRDIEQAGAAVMTVDVTWSPDKLNEVAQNAIKVYGRVDYLINNAGYGYQGTIEEMSHQETHDLFSANVFGVMNVTRSFLPHFRERRSGGIIIMSSIASTQYFPGGAMYCITKAAVAAVGEALKVELDPLGIKVLTVDLGKFRTSFLERDTNLKKASQMIPDYKPVNDWFDDFRDKIAGNQPNDPKLGVLRIIEIITQSGMATGKEVPGRIPLGVDAKEQLIKRCQDTVEQLEEWSDIICSTGY
ncbi:short-chain dehydrogenases reductases (SDR) family [Rhizoctonia solani]|uniref:Short-chain dehydrogenases reductases (SDR) family n=1 Tax=Rhizoctonia solani TaxID=456999 RepID=A0A8H7H1P0_9AGAM|nr:short-chain dehydrogenases reductases (SDR) family [Rhizoctonia solani]